MRSHNRIGKLGCHPITPLTTAGRSARFLASVFVGGGGDDMTPLL
jgi:hypothetical protein